ncbi:MAG TPA: hypothetical protein VFL77_08895 [Solirubrobacterales bacterium]|nr:hypothetical protein [Solirubrobacterales bacterium]
MPSGKIENEREDRALDLTFFLSRAGMVVARLLVARNTLVVHGS